MNPPHTHTQFTVEAFHSRTGLHNCRALSFKDVAEGALPDRPLSSEAPTSEAPSDVTCSTLEMTICSFALHLVESQSELFSLLWELRCVKQTMVSVPVIQINMR